MAVRQEDRHPIVEILRQTPDIPETCQWGLFLRNHDELTLEMVTDEERDYMYQTYASDPQMRINVGIRRRLAPLIENSRRRIELMNSLLFSLPGTPVDLLRRRDRHGRQHLSGRPQRRAHADAVDRRSQRRLLARRRGAALRAGDHRPGLWLQGGQRRGAGAGAVLAAQLDEAAHRPAQTASVFGRGSIEFVASPQPQGPRLCPRATRTTPILCVANLSRSVQPVELDLSRFRGMVPVEMFGQTEFPRIGDQPYFLSLGAYAFNWFRLQQAAAGGQRAHVAGCARRGAGSARRSLWERCGTRCSTATSARSSSATCSPGSCIGSRGSNGRGRARRASRTGASSAGARNPSSSRSSKPSSTTRSVASGTVTGSTSCRWPWRLAMRPKRCRSVFRRRSWRDVSGARKGAIYDAWHDTRFVDHLLEAVGSDTTTAMRFGQVQSQRGSAFPQLRRASDLQPAAVAKAATADGVIYRGSLALKLFRRVEPGVHPEIEITEHLSRCRLFARAAGCGHRGLRDHWRRAELGCDVHAAAAVRRGADRRLDARDGVARAVVRSGSGAQPAGRCAAGECSGEAPPAPVAEVLATYLEVAATLGRRTAEMHLALVDPVSTIRGSRPSR